MNNPQTWTLKSELREDWQLLYPIFKFLAILIAIYLVVKLIRFVALTIINNREG